jgi:hypothetical protein
MTSTATRPGEEGEKDHKTTFTGGSASPFVDKGVLVFESSKWSTFEAIATRIYVRSHFNLSIRNVI